RQRGAGPDLPRRRLRPRGRLPARVGADAPSVRGDVRLDRAAADPGVRGGAARHARRGRHLRRSVGAGALAGPPGRGARGPARGGGGGAEAPRRRGGAGLMVYLEAIVLGLVQGLTEFLPISSSAHLAIVGQILGGDDPGAAFTAISQLGTEAAVLVFFWRDI